MKTRISLPSIPESDRTPVINMLLKVIDQQQEVIQKMEQEIELLKSEIKRLKKHNQRPKIGPSKMEKSGKGFKGESKGKRPGSWKRKKTANLVIHKSETIKLKEVPFGSKFKGHDRFVIQDMEIKPVNTEYKLERWQLSTGEYIVAKLPVELSGNHFGTTLRSYIIYQYHHQGVTQPLLLEQLREWDVDISSGQLNRILTEDKDSFHDEKFSLLESGLNLSSYIQVDDTGARHAGKNGYCTHIGNEFFTWFSSTASKSRINFLELLRSRYKDYYIDQNALDYMRQQRLPKIPYNKLQTNDGLFSDQQVWLKHIKDLDITKERHIRIATEGALVGSILRHGFNLDMSIISDDAGQFNIFQHGLCWIHAERKINELIPGNDAQAETVDMIRGKFWQLYAELKIYKEAPNDKLKQELNEKFDELFNIGTSFGLLNLVLKRLKRNKSELLLVLEKPEIPLHNNLSERDIREYVKRRKISGSTRSDDGRECRDTFASLKKTCKKLKVKFWDYLCDRINKKNNIPSLPLLIKSAIGNTS